MILYSEEEGILEPTLTCVWRDFKRNSNLDFYDWADRELIFAKWLKETYEVDFIIREGKVIELCISEEHYTLMLLKYTKSYDY